MVTEICLITNSHKITQNRRTHFSIKNCQKTFYWVTYWVTMINCGVNCGALYWVTYWVTMINCEVNCGGTLLGDYD